MGGGGAERIVATLGEYFTEDKDVDARIILFEKNDFYKPNKNIVLDYLGNFTGKESPIIKLFMLPVVAWKLKTYVKKNKIDIIQSHLYRANYVNVMAKLMGAKHESQIVNHDNFFRGYKNSFFGRQKLKLVKLFYKRADKIIAISEDMKEGMEDLLEKRVEKINNPYDIEMMKERSKEEVTELRDDKEYIISVGSLIPLKRVEDVIEGYSRVATKNDEYDLIILGDGQERERLEELSKILGVGKRVHFMGRVENPFKFLRKSSIFVMASESEGFPNVLIEAMASGCQVVASDCISGPREIINPSLHKKVEKMTTGGYGVLYPVGDVDGLSNGIEEVVKNISRFNVKERADHFQKDIIMKQYKEVLLHG